jgi:hypothetical protein
MLQPDPIYLRSQGTRQQGWSLFLGSLPYRPTSTICRERDYHPSLAQLCPVLRPDYISAASATDKYWSRNSHIESKA